jgi:tRNA (guanine37-N1)-methyltransferase
MTSLRTALQKKLKQRELVLLRTAFDIIGDIAVLEIPAELEGKEKVIAETLLNLHKNIKVVAKKSAIHKGEFRTRKVRILAGEKRKTTVHTESGCRFRLHLERTYFSPRFGTERLRIAEMVKKGEKVLVMFSGAAPFCIVIAKNAKPALVVGVEKNRDAHTYASENIVLNRVSNVRLHLGDVNRVLPQLKTRFDRVIMPLPRGGEDFLITAIKKLKRGGMLHFYDFLHQDEFRLAHQKIERASKQLNRKSKTVRTVKCGQFGPRIYRICVDSVV